MSDKFKYTYGGEYGTTYSGGDTGVGNPPGDPPVDPPVGDPPSEPTPGKGGAGQREKPERDGVTHGPLVSLLRKLLRALGIMGGS